MNDQEVLQKIETCFSSVFTETFDFNSELKRENFSQWDSLHHIKLLVELEKTFGVRFDGAAATVLTSVDNILAEVKERLN